MSKAKTKQQTKHNITHSFAIEFRNTVMAVASLQAASQAIEDAGHLDCAGHEVDVELRSGWVSCELDGGAWDFTVQGVSPRKGITARYGHDELHQLAEDLISSLKPAKTERIGGFDLDLTSQGTLRIGCKTLTPEDLKKVADSLSKFSTLTGIKRDDGITIKTEGGSSIEIYDDVVSIDNDGYMTYKDAIAVLRWAGVKTTPAKKAKAKK